MLVNLKRALSSKALTYSLFRTTPTAIHGTRQFHTSNHAYREKSPSRTLKTSQRTQNLAFDKTAYERWPAIIILRNWFAFIACQAPGVVDISPKVMNIGNHRLNPFRPVFHYVMRQTIYSQFVGGASDKEIGKTCYILGKQGIEPMFAIPMETENIVAGFDVAKWQSENTKKLVDCIEKAAKFAVKFKPVIHIKLTGILDDHIFVNTTKHIGLELDKGSSAEKFRDCVDELVEFIKDNQSPSKTYSQFLSEDDVAKVRHCADRLGRMAAAIKATKTQVLIDAEYVKVNPMITVLTMALARVCNTQDVPYVWNTYQCYMKNAGNLVDFEIDYLRGHGCAWGAKIVRGAYMEKERALAEAGGYEDPICDNLQATHDNYNGVVAGLVDRYRNGEKVQFLVASHNEETVRKTVAKIEEIEASGKQVGDDIIFGQLYGMCDHVSCGIANVDLPVYKSMPIGEIGDVLPYLSRRAAENKTILAGSHRERGLLWEALKDKVFSKNS